jgi:hypothetical protein
MKMGKGTNMLIEDYISRDVNTTYRGIKTLKSLVEIIVPQKHTSLGTEFKFLSIIGSKVRPNRTTKGEKKRIIWWFVKQQFMRCGIVDDLSG